MTANAKANILIINGPNMSLIGKREKSTYGQKTLLDLLEQLTSKAKEYNLALSHKQSNYEGEIINFIHQAAEEDIDYIIINPAAYGHTSIAIRDALLAVSIPFIEVHMSNIHAREKYRHKTYLSDIAMGVIFGFKEDSYNLALTALINHLQIEA
jgi:3-dehydroquinate dehydratase-2